MLEAEVFVAVLPCSHYTFVRAVKSQQRDDFILCMNQALSWFAGVPKAIVCDNLRSAVSKGHKYALLINKTLLLCKKALRFSSKGFLGYYWEDNRMYRVNSQK